MDIYNTFISYKNALKSVKKCYINFKIIIHFDFFELKKKLNKRYLQLIKKGITYLLNYVFRIKKVNIFCYVNFRVEN